MQHIVLAGSSFIFGLSEIQDALHLLDIDSYFADAPFMLGYKEILEKDKINFSDTIPKGAKVLPLSEYWISHCLNEGNGTVSKKALLFARDKTLLKALKGSPRIIESIDEAKKIVLDKEKKVIVKPSGLFSGLGVKVIGKENLFDLEKIIFNASNIKNRATKLFNVRSNKAIITEYIEGEEMSADVFFFKGDVSLVRLCRKEVVLVHGTPCTIAYQMIDTDSKIMTALKTWCKEIFLDCDISFAQFDFIKNKEKSFVPIDFAPRIGGGIEELLKESGKNVYAKAIESISQKQKTNEENKLLEMQEKETCIKEKKMLLTQFNYLPTKSGKIFDDNYNLIEGKKFIYKKKGDFVPECPSSTASRIATVITEAQFPIDQKTLSSLLIGEKHIGHWKQKK